MIPEFPQRLFGCRTRLGGEHGGRGGVRGSHRIPRHIRPYLGEIPAMDVDAFLRWTHRTPGIPVPAPQLTELIETAVCQPAGEAELPSAN